LVVSDIRNPFFIAISRAVEDSAYEQGYSVLLRNTDENPEKEELYLNVLHDENVAGIIFSPTHQFRARVSTFNSNMPFLIIDRTVNSKEMDMILLDNVVAGYELTTHLIENGYRKIAGLFGNASTTAPELADHIAELIASGVKTTTSSLLWSQQKHKWRLEEPGTKVLSWIRKKTCVHS
jgi:LacI family transcriptional regulator, fructose operon transcriptional repressor